MCKTMQQQDHDAWELGYGVNSTANDDRMNKLELKAMYEYLARQAAEKASAEAKAASDEEEEMEAESISELESQPQTYHVSDLPPGVRTPQQLDHDAWENAPKFWEQ